MSDPKPTLSIPTLADQAVAHPTNVDLSWTQAMTSDQRSLGPTNPEQLRAIYSRILSESDDPEAEVAKLRLSEALAPVFGQPAQWVADNLDTLAPALTGAPKKPQNFLEEVGRAFDIGNKQVELAHRGALLMAQVTGGQADPQGVADAKALYEQLNLLQGGAVPLSALFSKLKGQMMQDLDGGILGALKLPFEVPLTLAGEAVKATATQVPQLGTMAVAGVGGALIGTGVAAAAGAMTPAEAVTIPAGFLSGFWTGAAAAGAEQEAGQMYTDLLFNPATQGIDPKLAAFYAGTYGAVAGALEKVGLEKIPGVKTALAKAAEATTAALVAKGTLRTAMKEHSKGLVKDFAIGWATEAGTEMAQQAAQSILTEMAKQTANELQNAHFAPEDIKNIVQDVVDSGWQAALAYPLLGAAGTGVEVALRSRETVKEWKAQGVAEEKLKTAEQSAAVASQVAAAKPTEAQTPEGGVRVYFAGPQTADLQGLATGVRLFETREEAEAAARETTAAPMDRNSFLSAIDEQFPPAVGQLARTVLDQGAQAGKSLITPDGPLAKWQQASDGHFDPADIIELADGIRTGQAGPDRNQLAAHYGLEQALPVGQITEGILAGDRTQKVATRDQVDQAFKDGAQAVFFAGQWYIRSPDALTVTGRQESQVSAAARNPVGELSFGANDGTIRALRPDGTEVGRLSYDQGPTGPRVSALEVPQEYRRQGVASALVRNLQEKNPGKALAWPEKLSSEGTAFVDSVRRQSPAYDRFSAKLARAEEQGNAQAAAYYRAKLDKTSTPRASANLTADELRTVLMTGTTMDDHEVEATLATLGRMAGHVGMSTDQFLQQALESVRTVDQIKDEQGQPRPGANGVTLITKAGRRIVELSRGRAEASTVLHELFHVLRPLLAESDQAELLKWTGEEGWTPKAEELAARGFEQRILEGKTGPVDHVLDTLRDIFRAIYESFVGDRQLEAQDETGARHAVVLTDEARAVFDRILSAPEVRQVGPHQVKILGVGDLPIFQEGEGLAPNGRPSKLSPAQYRQVRTPEFKAWFGDWENDPANASKALDSNGEPLVVWHGTPDGRYLKDEAVFKSQRERIGVGSEVGVHWFAESRKTAQSYADPRRAFDYQNAEPAVLPAFLNLRNPIILDGEGKNWREVQAHGKTADVVSRAIREGNDGVLIRNVKDDYNNGKGTAATTTATVFRSTQIKSATENSGAFDPENPSILFQDSLDVDVLELQLEKARTNLAELDDPKVIDTKIAAMTFRNDTDPEAVRHEFKKEADRLRQAIADDEEALRVLKESLANQIPREDREKEAARRALEAGLVVPTATLEAYRAEAWAAAELERRADLRDLMEASLAYDDPAAFIDAQQTEKAIGSGEWDPFGDQPEPAAQPATPEEDALYRKAYTMARMKTPAEFDKEFVESLTPTRVKAVLSIIGKDPAKMARDKIPRHVAAQALKAANDKPVNEGELARIETTMRNSPRVYRQQSWEWVQGGERDEFLVEVLAYERFAEQQLAEMDPPEVTITPLELSPDLPIQLAAELLTSTKSRNAWQSQAMDAEREAGHLDHALSAVENLMAKWKDEKAKAAAEEEATQALAVVGGTYLTKLKGVLDRISDRAEVKKTEVGARVAEDLQDLTREIKAALRAKEAEKRATFSAFERMRQMGKFVARPVPKTVDVEYARQIERLRVLVDPNFRRMDTLKLRQAEAEFYAQHPEILSTLSRAERVKAFAKSLNLWTAKDLEALYEERKALEELGKEKMRARIMTRKNRIEEMKRRIYGGIYKEWADLNKQQAEARAAGRTNEAAVLAQKILTWETQKGKELTNFGQADDKRGRGGELQSLVFTIGNVGDILDGGQDYKGPNVELLWKIPNKAENAFLEQKIRRVDSMFEWIKENKIPVRRLFDRVAVDGVKGVWTLDTLMDIYMGMKNEKKAAAIKFGNRIDPKVIEFAQRAPELEWVRKMGDKILDEYEGNQERLFQAIREVQNIDPVYERNYSPIQRAEIDLEALDEQVKYEQGLATAIRSATVEKGFSVDREDIPDEYQKPIRLGAWTAWLDQVVRQEQYIAYAPLVQDMKAIYHDSGIKTAITQNRGSGYYREIDNYINTLANRYWGKSFTWFDRAMGRLQSNAAVAFMSYNLSTALKQIPAIFTFLGHARPDLLLWSALRAPMIVKLADAKSVQIRGRIERFGFIAIDQGRKKTAAGRFAYEVSHIGMQPMQLVDKVTTAIGWNACFETAKARGLADPDAVEYADWVVDQTQQANHPKATAGAYRNQNALLRTLLMFTGPSNKIFNQVTYGNYQAINQGHYGKSIMTTIGIGLSLVVFWSLGNGGPPETDEDWEKALGAGMVELLPIIGPAVAAMIRGYNQSQAPVQQVLQSASDSIQGATRAATVTSEAARVKAATRAITSALDGVGLVAGVPVTQPLRILRAANEGNGWELLGWRKRE